MTAAVAFKEFIPACRYTGRGTGAGRPEFKDQA